MKKIVFFGGKIQSSFNTIIPVIKELLKNGSEVNYFGYTEFKEEIESLGVKFYLYKQLGNKVDLVRIENIIEEDIVKKNILKIDMLFKLWKVYRDNEIDIVRGINPDLIFRDNDAIQGLYIAKELKIKSIGINCMPYISEKYMKMNPLTNYMAYYGVYFKNIKGINKHFYDDIEKSIKNLCIENGLPYINQSYLVSGCDDINICFGGKSINKIIGDEDKVKVIIPILKGELNLNEEIDEKLRNMLESHKSLIYMASGLMINFDNEYYNYVINSVIGSDYNLIISIPDIESYNNNLPNNIIIISNIPQERILKKAAVFLTAGGYNSICEAITFEVPMIIKPLMNDQHLNAIIIEELGIGVNLENAELYDEFIAVQLNNKKYKKNIKKVHEEISTMQSLKSVIKDLVT